jgi:hypothetical protein
MPDTEMEEMPSCPNCSNNADDCDCSFTCQHCDERVDSTCSQCDNCERHCNCSSCPSCSRRSEDLSVCPNCDSCTDHCCECYYCSVCDSRTTDYCGECERCDGCCSCGESGPRLNGRFSYIGSPSKDVPRYVSHELEYNSCEDHDVIASTSQQYGDALVADGSLGDAGYEINTNPTRGVEYFTHIAATVKATQLSNSSLSSGCGMHIHVDARDLNWHDLFKLAVLYSKVEDALFAMQPRSRQDNDYCRRVGTVYAHDPKAYKHDLLKGLYGKTFPKNRREAKPNLTTRKGKRVFGERIDKYNRARYYALNIHTYFYRGTIEFRHGAGTKNVEKATNWGLVCMWIVEKASTMTHAQIKALPGNSTLALLEILPAKLGEWVIARQREQESRD